MAAGTSATTTPADAATDAGAIEGVWSFNGGRIAVQQEPKGFYIGTVVSPTKFDECEHEVGERMWFDVEERSDGSFWGQHQWFSGDGKCRRLDTPGYTAWRVLRTAGGARYLRVCFSHPETPTQPLIPAAGEPLDATFGCADSALISGDTVTEFGQYLRLPANGKCIGRQKLRIRIHDVPNDPVAKLDVTLKKRQLERRAKIIHPEGKTFAVLRLKGLPPGRFRVRVEIDTVLGNHLSGRRTYVRCGPPKAKRSVPVRSAHAS